MLQWTKGCLCPFKLVFWVPSDIFPEVGSLSLKADSFLNFWDVSIQLSTVAAPIYVSTNCAKGFPFLHILTSTSCLLIYWWHPFWQVWGEITLWFQFAVLWWLVTLNIFSYIYWTSACPLWRSIYSSPLPIFWLGCLFFWWWVL